MATAPPLVLSSSDLILGWYALVLSRILHSIRTQVQVVAVWFTFFLALSVGSFFVVLLRIATKYFVFFTQEVAIKAIAFAFVHFVYYFAGRHLPLVVSLRLPLI